MLIDSTIYDYEYDKIKTSNKEYYETRKQIIDNPISYLNCPTKIIIGLPQEENNKVLIKRIKN